MLEKIKMSETYAFLHFNKKYEKAFCENNYLAMANYRENIRVSILNPDGSLSLPNCTETIGPNDALLKSNKKPEKVGSVRMRVVISTKNLLIERRDLDGIWISKFE